MIRRIIRSMWRRAEWLGSERRKAMNRLRFGPSIRFAPGVFLSRGAWLEIFDGGSIDLGSNTFVDRNTLLSARGGRIVIGPNSRIGTCCVIASTTKISVGEGALIAERVTIRDQDHAHGDPSRYYYQQGRSEAPIWIGANVWLGANVTITRNVEISEGCMIGANSVVTRSLPESGKYVGAPVRRLWAEKKDSGADGIN